MPDSYYCSNGHPLNTENLHIRKDCRGWRCRACEREQIAARRARRKANPPPPPPPIPLVPLDFDGACVGSPEPSLWDNHVDGEAPPQRIQRHALAISICRSCPSQLPCLERRGESEGVWGGRLFSKSYREKVA